MEDKQNDVVELLYKSIYDGKGAKEAQNDIDKTGNKAENMGDKLSYGFDGVKWAVLGQAIKKATNLIVDATKVSADYVETLNVLQVAFDGNTESIRKFSSKIADTLNLDDSTIIKASAHFKVLTQSMGMATETGEKLSKLMTQMTLDLSSLYNMDFARAQTALQYAMEGRGTSLKQRTGVSVLESTVQTTMEVLGIDAYVEDMNDAEKAIARVISMEYQLMSSQGDLARTIEAPANQMRVMREQLSMLARNIGNVFLPAISAILPYLNAFLIVLNAIISALARLVGYREDMFDTFEDAGSGVEYFEGVGDAIDGVGKSAEKTANKLKSLRGFDKLNVIRTPQESSGGGGGAGGGGAGGINPNLLKAFNEMADKYKNTLDKVKTRATEIAEKILKWLGFAKKINEVTGKTEWYLKKITGGTILGALATGGIIYLGINKILKLLNKIGLIKFGSLKELVGLFKSGTIATNLTKFTTGFKTLATTLGISTGALAGIVTAIVAVGTALIHAYRTNEDFRKSVDNLFKTIVNLFTTLYEKIEPTLTDIYNLIVPVWNIIKESVIFAVTAIYDTIVFIFQQIIDSFSGWATILTDIINGDYGKAFKDLQDMVKKLWENWNKYFDKIKEKFKTWAENVWKDIQEFIPKAIDKFDDIVKWFDELPAKIKDASKKATEWALEEFAKLYEWFSELPGKIKNIIEHPENYPDLWEKIGEFIIEGILKGILLTELKIIKWVCDLPSKIQNALWQVWGTIQDIGWNIVSGILEGMWNFVNGGGLKKIGNGILNSIKGALGIASPSKLIINAKIGDFSMEAIAIGMEKQLPLIEKEAESIVDSLNKGIKNVPLQDLPSVDSLIVGNGVGSNLVNSIGNKSNTVNSNIVGNQRQSGGLNNATFIIQVGDEQLAKKVLKDLNGMAKSNGKPITITG